MSCTNCLAYSLLLHVAIGSVVLTFEPDAISTPVTLSPAALTSVRYTTAASASPEETFASVDLTFCS